MVKSHNSWKVGLVSGLIAAPLVLYAGAVGYLSGKALEFIVAIPPLLLASVRGLDDTGFAVLYTFWWALVGAMLGWCAGKGKPGRALAVVVIAGLTIGHYYALMRLKIELDQLSAVMGELLRGLFQ